MTRRASKVVVVGPLEAHGAGFEAALADAGDTPLSAVNHLGSCGT